MLYIAKPGQDLPFVLERVSDISTSETVTGRALCFMLMASAIRLTWVTTRESRVREAYGSFLFAVVRFHTSALPT